jgi:hypothetical protein
MASKKIDFDVAMTSSAVKMKVSELEKMFTDDTQWYLSTT